MSIVLSDLKCVGSAVMPNDNSATEIGGAVDKTKKVGFYDVSGSVQVVGESASDTSQTITLYYRNAAGSLLNESKVMSGQTPVAFTATPERLLRATKSATGVGAVAIEAVTGDRAGTAQAGAATSLTLDAGASAVDGAYNGKVLRLTGGTGAGQIRQIIDYNGTSKVATVNYAWGTNPDGTTTFKVASGMVFDKAPTEVGEVRRPFYDVAANPAGGAAVDYYEKIFLGNEHGSNALNAATVKEYSDPSGLVTFALAAAKDDAGTNGSGNNRTVAPDGVTFNSADKAVPTGQLGAGEYIGVWLKLSLAAGQAATKTQYVPQLTGTTS